MFIVQADSNPTPPTPSTPSNVVAVPPAPHGRRAAAACSLRRPRSSLAWKSTSYPKDLKPGNILVVAVAVAKWIIEYISIPWHPYQFYHENWTLFGKWRLFSYLEILELYKRGATKINEKRSTSRTQPLFSSQNHCHFFPANFCAPGHHQWLHHTLPC